jgi:lipopolysaccharide export system permease protein
MVKLLDRFIFSQLLDYFLLGIVIFTLIGFFSDAFLDFLQDLQKFGISFTTALAMMGLQLPKIVTLVLPASSFLAVLMVYNALNNSFEIAAIRMNGISLRRLLMPALVLGFIATSMAYWLSDYVVPYCNQQTDRLKNIAIQKGTLPLGRESFMFKDYDDNHNLQKMIYIGKYDGTELKDSTIIDLKQDGVMQVIQSKSGQWTPTHWEFRNANAYTVSKNTDKLFFNHLGSFQIKNLLEREEDKESEKEALDRATQGIAVDSDTQPFGELFGVIQKREALGKKVKNTSYIRLWEKLTLPLSCLAIILTAVPLALTPPRQGSNRGFIFALGVLFLYYVIRSVCVNLGQSGQLSFHGAIAMPYSLLIAAWLPIAILTLLGVGLLIRKSKVL